MNLAELDNCDDARIWLNADDQIYARPYHLGPAYLDRRQQAKFERVRQARLLYRGKHRTFFLFERRTQQPFKEISVNGRRMMPYFNFNLLRLISRKTSDLLFGEETEIKVADEIQQGKLNDLVERTALPEMLKDAAIVASWGGEVSIEACVHQGEVYLQPIPPDEIFPVGGMGPDRQYATYDRFQPRNVGTYDKPDWVLLITHYRVGTIERELWRVDAAGMRQSQVDVGQWAAMTGEPPLAPSERTGVPWPTITWVPNEMDEGRPASDYDGLVGLQDLVNAKQTQIANILQQHSDPWMVFPIEMADEEGNIKAEYKAFFARDPQNRPGYVTFDGQLDSAMKDRSHAVSALLITAEMSPVLLGLEEGAAPEAFKTLRLRANNSLAMAGRKAKTWKSAIRLMIETAQALEHALPGTRYDRGSIAVTPRDGIPVDELEQAQTLSLLKSASLLSTERGVSLLVPDPAGQEKEVSLIKDEAAADAAAAMPTIFGEPSGGGGGAGKEGPGANKAASGDLSQGSDGSAAYGA